MASLSKSLLHTLAPVALLTLAVPASLVIPAIIKAAKPSGLSSGVT